MRYTKSEEAMKVAETLMPGGVDKYQYAHLNQ